MIGDTKKVLEHANESGLDPVRGYNRKQRNLLEPFDDLGPFDIIFCRNVAIYFNKEDREHLFERTARVLSPNGWLFVGSSESLADLGPRWQPQQHCHANCYHPNGSSQQTAG